MIRVGNLEICKSRRVVYRDGLPISLSARTVDLLLLLAEASGQLVLKKDIIKAVWPRTAVDESNLYVHVSAIRKLLGPYRRLLVGVSGRGYQLNIENRPEHTLAVQADGDQSLACSALPLSQTFMFGRDDDIRHIHGLLKPSRVVTLTGAGGIGKTTLAVQSAKLVQADFLDGVFFVELARFGDATSVHESIDEVVSKIQNRFIRPKSADRHNIARALLVLDNCEHVVEAVSHSVAALMATPHQIAVLATSRVPLETINEVVYHVQPLQCVSELPPTALTSLPSAVAMFVSLARAIDPQFAGDPQSVELVCQLCRRLDGLPLAIEIAAARAAVLGIHALSEAINERFNSLSGGFRTALPRHQTLAATFDWSYRLLEADEQKVFRRIGVLQAEFSVADAIAAIADEDISENEVAEAISGLCAKSLLISSDEGQNGQKFRLHFTSRAYALQKLDDNGERQAMEARVRSAACSKILTGEPVWPPRSSRPADRQELPGTACTYDIGLHLGIPGSQFGVEKAWREVENRR